MQDNVPISRYLIKSAKCFFILFCFLFVYLFYPSKVAITGCGDEDLILIFWGAIIQPTTPIIWFLHCLGILFWGSLGEKSLVFAVVAFFFVFVNSSCSSLLKLPVPGFSILIRSCDGNWLFSLPVVCTILQAPAQFLVIRLVVSLASSLLKAIGPVCALPWFELYFFSLFDSFLVWEAYSTAIFQAESFRLHLSGLHYSLKLWNWFFLL